MSPKKKFSTVWLLLMAAGVIFISIGVFAFVRPLSGYIKLVKYTGISLFAAGVILQALVVYRKQNALEKTWLQVESILHFLFALILSINPLLSFIALPDFIGAWILLGGVIKVLNALSERGRAAGWQMVLGAGVLSVLFGVVLLFSSLVRLADIAIVIGGYGLVMGALYISDAFRFSKKDESLNIML